MRRLLYALLVCVALPAVAYGQAPSETVEYYGQDAIGSIRIVFAPDGTVLGRQDYAPFGRPLFPVPAMPKESFGAQEKDHETDEGYFHARMFEARTGRFTSPDPIQAGLGEPQRWNRYAYGLNRPVTVTDVTGLNAQSDPGFTCSNPEAYAELHCADWQNFLNFWTWMNFGSILGPGPGPSYGARTPGGTAPPATPASAGDPEESDVTNNSSNTIFVKPEHNEDKDKIVAVDPGKTWHGKQDGIADPCNHPGQVFKSIDFTDVQFSPTITVAVPQIVTTIVPGVAVLFELKQAYSGGWKGEIFHQAHADWDSLFKTANQSQNCR